MNRTPSLGLLTFGKEYADAGDALMPTPVSPTPSYYLFGHALELMLKAFLRAQGWSLEALVKLRHNLQRILEVAREAGLDNASTLKEEHVEALGMLSECYRSKELEYITVGVKRLPDRELLSEFAHALYADLEGHCYEQTKSEGF